MGFASLAAGSAWPVESLSPEGGQCVCQGFSLHSVQRTHPHSLFHQLRISCFGALITAGKPPPLCHALLGRSGSQVLPTGIVMAPGRVSCPHLHAGIRGYKNLAFWFLWGKKKNTCNTGATLPSGKSRHKWTVPGPLQSGHAHLSFCYPVV